MTNYNIMRFFRSGRRRVIHHDVSLDVAQLHCRDERTHKKDKNGGVLWFDGYEDA